MLTSFLQKKSACRSFATVRVSLPCCSLVEHKRSVKSKVHITTMAFQNDRQMFDVDLQCADCNTAITQLPFQPSGDKPVFCTNCLRAKRADRGPRFGGNGSRPQRQMFDVDVNCASCGTHISQLPFQPSGDRPIYCFDCNKNRRG